MGTTYPACVCATAFGAEGLHQTSASLAVLRQLYDLGGTVRLQVTVFPSS